MINELVELPTAKIASTLGFTEECLYCISEEEGIESARDFTGNTHFNKSDIENARENGHLVYLCPTKQQLREYLIKEYNVNFTLDFNGRYYNKAVIFKPNNRVCIVSNSERLNFRGFLNKALYTACEALIKHKEDEKNRLQQSI